MIIAKHRQLTSEVLFSWDEGKTWQSMGIPEMEVINIVTEPQTTSQRFVVMGRTRQTSNRAEDGTASLDKAKLVYIDLTPLHERQCTGVENPGAESSDYELWSPTPVKSRFNPNNCQLGTKVAYIRRKRGHACFNGVEHEGHNETQICECTQGDYVCEYGYERKSESLCDYQKGFYSDTEKDSLAADLALVYKHNTHQQEVCARHPKVKELVLKPSFRLVAGTKCKGGLQFKSSVLPCEGNMNETEEVEYQLGMHWGYILMGLAVLIGGCCVMRLYYKYSATVGDGYAPVNQGNYKQQSGVQVFGEIDPDMDDDYGEDELLAEGVLGTPDDDDLDGEDDGGGRWRLTPDQIRHNNRGTY